MSVASVRRVWAAVAGRHDSPARVAVVASSRHANARLKAGAYVQKQVAAALVLAITVEAQPFACHWLRIGARVERLPVGVSVSISV